VKTLATLSDGEKFENQKHYRKSLGRIQGLSKGLSRKGEGSQNRWKQTKKLARAHYRVACQRQDALHKMSRHVTRTYALIGLEDLNTKGMLANHRLAQAVRIPVSLRSSGNCSTRLSNTVALCSWWIGGTHRAKRVPDVAEETRISPWQRECSSAGSAHW
jgi:transposase